jgi:hypothetical protein
VEDGLPMVRLRSKICNFYCAHQIARLFSAEISAVRWGGPL